MKYLFYKLSSTVLLFSIFFSCSSNDPEKENVPEVITKVKMTFTPKDAEGTSVSVTATDPDNDGPKDIKVDKVIELVAENNYDLSLELINELYKPEEEGYSITEEVEEEGAEHQFFFSWSEGLFTAPTGTGNIDEKEGLVNYVDKDQNGLPIGLKTEWTTAKAFSGNDRTFRVVLKHQPDVKSGTSSYEDGEDDLDLTFSIRIN